MSEVWQAAKVVGPELRLEEEDIGALLPDGIKTFFYCLVTDTEPNNGRYDTQHNDTQHNEIEHNDTQHKDIQHNDIQHNDIQHNYTQHMRLTWDTV